MNFTNKNLLQVFDEVTSNMDQFSPEQFKFSPGRDPVDYSEQRTR